MPPSPTQTESLQDNYGKGAFGGKIGFGTRQALVMVDFAQAYFVPASPLFANRAGNPLAGYVPELTPLASEPVVTKQYASAFFGTSLSSTLRAQGVDCVLIAGMSTSGCVRASTVDAIQHGFIPVVVGDACGDRHPQPHDANLFDLNAKYADVLTLAQLQATLIH